MPSNQFKAFFKAYAEKIKDLDCMEKSHETLDRHPLLLSQAIYLVNWKTIKIDYQRGIDKLLGYTKEEFNHDLLSEFYHPDDIRRYVYLVKLTNEWARKLKPDPFSIETLIDYRIKKKDGSYIKVMRQSTVFESCVDKSLKSSFSLLTDISRIKTSTSVNLSVISRKNGRILLEDNQDQITPPPLSPREKEILIQLKEGLNSKAIAEKLHISCHTVDTHRRNMLAKTKCKNVVELVQLATRLGSI